MTTVHNKEVQHVRKRGATKGYHIYGVTTQFDYKKTIVKNDEEHYEVFMREPDFYESIIDYYKENLDPDIAVYEEHGEAENDSNEN